MSDRAPLWLFGYGSLIWRPASPFVERRPASARGYARRFWQGSTDHRGVPEAPGRVVTLLPSAGDRCEGVAYRVPATGTVCRVQARVLDPGLVVDTVGAGDSFMAGLISGLLDTGLAGSAAARAALAGATEADLEPAITRALMTSGVTVRHAGAYSPTRDELEG